MVNFKDFFKRKEKKEKDTRIEFFKEKIKKKSERKVLIQQRKHRLGFYLEKAGLNINTRKISKTIFNLCVLINLVISFYLIYFFSTNLGITLNTLIISIAAVWILVFVVILFVLWIFLYVAIDLKIFKRKLDIEDVLPDFLQLTASNIKAGMTVDRALWYAVRPRFGVLAKEIETVAKDTIGGEDLKSALTKFVSKYDSLLLKRSISLLIEGLEAGGEIGDLLNRIAMNIQEIKTMRKEMAANVATYTIFISFASILAAPVLFALAGVLIRVIKDLGSSIGNVPSGSFALSFSGAGVTYGDFRIFAIVSLIITGFFSAAIIATIKKGNIKTGVKYIPIFIAVSLVLFFIADFLLGKLTGVFF